MDYTGTIAATHRVWGLVIHRQRPVSYDNTSSTIGFYSVVTCKSTRVQFSIGLGLELLAILMFRLEQILYAVHICDNLQAKP